VSEPGSSTPVSDDEEGRAFLQERLGLFVRAQGLLLAFTVPAALVAFGLYPDQRPRHVEVFVALIVAGLMGVTSGWLLLRTRQLGRRVLQALDANASVGTGLLVGVGGFFVLREPEYTSFSFVVVAFTMLARAVAVPSTAARSFWLTTGTMGIVVVSNCLVAMRLRDKLNIPLPVYVVGGLVLGALTVALATSGSAIIFGLRRQIRQAQRLGQYTLGDKIGEGGMGAVYKARHALLRRPTAIKLLPAQKAGSDSIARFEREVQHTAELTHPNTIQIFDYGRSADGVFYYAMEYLEGTDLERLVARHGPMPPARVIHVLRQMCDALDEAHDRGLVHRDIKPANVILCRRGRQHDVVKVLDFGLVKALATDDQASTAGVVTGTPAYLAPEAITAPTQIGAVSDLYAVGAVAYYLLTGTTVFRGATVAEVCGHHVHSAPEPPSRRRPVPPDLEALVLRCLAKTPGDRPASARMLRDALVALPDAGDWTEAQAAERWQLERAAEAFSAQPGSGPAGAMSATMVAVDLTRRA
jgi:eukaryotic-like serine/threonine-protein kinase